jgi:hypothetical protein
VHTSWLCRPCWPWGSHAGAGWCGVPRRVRASRRCPGHPNSEPPRRRSAADSGPDIGEQPPVKQRENSHASGHQAPATAPPHGQHGVVQPLPNARACALSVPGEPARNRHPPSGYPALTAPPPSRRALPQAWPRRSSPLPAHSPERWSHRDAQPGSGVNGGPGAGRARPLRERAGGHADLPTRAGLPRSRLRRRPKRPAMIAAS